MWISKTVLMLLSTTNAEIADVRAQLADSIAQARQLSVENARLRSDQDWFKMRLNQVESERAQLIMAASGVKITHPTFVAAQEDPARALQELPDFAMVGADAPEDYSQMPKRDRN